MADEPTSPAGTRFSEDLQRIREDRGISIQDIQQDTQIAETLIESFEEARLYDHPTYNRVYLRSFVRAYASAIDIPQEQALESLDAALEGSYDHALADAHLTDSAVAPPSGEASADPSGDADPATVPDDVTDAPTAGGPEGRGGIVGPPRAIGDESEEDPATEAPSSAVPTDPSSPSMSSATDGDADEGGEPPDDEAVQRPATEEGEPDSTDTDGEEVSDSSASKGASPPDRPAFKEQDAAPEPEPSAAAAGGEAEAESVPSREETGIVGEPTALGSDQPVSSPAPPASEDSSPEAGAVPSTPAPSGSSFSKVNTRIYAIGVGIAVVVLMLIGVGVAYFSADSSSEQSTQEAAMLPASDTSAASAPVDTVDNRPPPADVQLGRSIHLTLQARTNVSGIRIQRDEDLRRPYWIQEGDADVFPFQDQVTIDSGLSDVRVLIEGYPYPVQDRDTTEGLEITRSDVEAFVDTLRGSPAALSGSPDTIAVGQPNQ